MQENKRNVYPWGTNTFSNQPVCCYLSSHVTDLKSSNQTELACAGTLLCSLIFGFLSNVKERAVILKVAIRNSELTVLTYDIYI